MVFSDKISVFSEANYFSKHFWALLCLYYALDTIRGYGDLHKIYFIT